MNEWFGPETGAWFSLFSPLSVLAIASYWIQQGKHKALVMSLYVGALGIGCMLLASGLVARIVEQPDHVIRPLLLAGTVVTVIFASLLGVVRAGYAQAELRKMFARDI
jgi:hypothetical protein